jgi:RimJ/RimL family protein N-acetyltransferase
MSPFLVGESIYLRALEPSDAPAFSRWVADREVVQYLLTAWQLPVSASETVAWLSKTIVDKDVLTLGIVEKSSDQLIGYAGIAGICRINRSGEYYICLGDKSKWGKGYGTEVTRLIVAHGFASLNLNRIMLTVSDVNGGGVKAYLRAGFKQEGVLRQACYRNGSYHDKIIMSTLKPEWEASQSA